jgi:cytochrome b
MNTETLKLIEVLANKLGTTSEYLWGILLRQAPIDAALNLLQMAIVVALWFVLLKIHKSLLVENDNGMWSESTYKSNEGAETFMVVSLIAIVVASVFCLFNIHSTINGFFNPEYWAIQEILSQLN